MRHRSSRPSGRPFDALSARGHGTRAAVAGQDVADRLSRPSLDRCLAAPASRCSSALTTTHRWRFCSELARPARLLSILPCLTLLLTFAHPFALATEAGVRGNHVIRLVAGASRPVDGAACVRGVARRLLAAATLGDLDCVQTSPSTARPTVALGTRDTRTPLSECALHSVKVPARRCEAGLGRRAVEADVSFLLALKPCLSCAFLRPQINCHRLVPLLPRSAAGDRCQANVRGYVVTKPLQDRCYGRRSLFLSQTCSHCGFLHLLQRLDTDRRQTPNELSPPIP
jgi:hypothetical protein